MTCDDYRSGFALYIRHELPPAEESATVEIVADIADLKHLERILTGVRKIPGVRDVQRLQKL